MYTDMAPLPFSELIPYSSRTGSSRDLPSELRFTVGRLLFRLEPEPRPIGLFDTLKLDRFAATIDDLVADSQPEVVESLYNPLAGRAAIGLSVIKTRRRMAVRQHQLF
jgi:hypothetical protein